MGEGQEGVGDDEGVRGLRGLRGGEGNHCGKDQAAG